MGRKDDIDAIVQMVPARLWTKLKESQERFAARLATSSDEELSEMRASLESISEQKPSQKWEEALAKAQNLADLQPLFREWKSMSERVRAQGWLDSR